MQQQHDPEAAARARETAIRAAIRAAAADAGAHAADDIPSLIARAAIKLNDDGGVDGIADALKKLREGKPWLFKEQTTSGTAPRPQPPNGAQRRSAKNMTDAEYRAARAEIRNRSFR